MEEWLFPFISFDCTKFHYGLIHQEIASLVISNYVQSELLSFYTRTDEWYYKARSGVYNCLHE